MRDIHKAEHLLFRWERLYNRLGFCVGMVNGAIYFFILMMPVYVAGYFTAEVADAGAPASVRLATTLRAELHDCGVDRVLAAFDLTPPVFYEAADIIELVLQFPLLESRLGHLDPGLLSFSQRKEMPGLGLGCGVATDDPNAGRIAGHPELPREFRPSSPTPLFPNRCTACWATT